MTDLSWHGFCVERNQTHEIRHKWTAGEGRVNSLLAKGDTLWVGLSSGSVAVFDANVWAHSLFLVRVHPRLIDGLID